MPTNDHHMRFCMNPDCTVITYEAIWKKSIICPCCHWVGTPTNETLHSVSD